MSRYELAEPKSLDEAVVWLNGNFYRHDEARISPFDHGFLYADGVLDSCACFDGKIFRLNEHIDRFLRSAHAIRIEVPLTKDQLRDVIIETVLKNGMRNCGIRMIVTRGVGEPFLNPGTCESPTLLVMVRPQAIYTTDEQRANGRKAIVASIRRPAPSGDEPRIKSISYINSILMVLEAEQAGVDFPIGLDQQGYVAEASGANIFILRDGHLMTPMAPTALEGITRAAVFEIASKEGIPVREALLSPYDLYVADEVFLTATGGTGAEVVPIVEIDRRTIGNGRPGEMTTRIGNELLELIKGGEHSVEAF